MNLMNHKLSGLAAAFALAASVSAQNYSIDWFTIDGGGGTSTGGVFSVSGTIGQPDAGVMSGGSYSLVGGFWGIIAAVQTPGAPLLSVERLGGNVRVFWPLPATDFLLDQTTALASPPAAIVWSQVPFPYSTNATHISITVPAPPGNKFYRLRKP
jgi:hypothetical protein